MHLVNQAFNWLIETSLVLTWVVMFAITAIAGDLGFRLGRRRADRVKVDDTARSTIGTLVAAMVTLLAFAMGLTISFAQGRFEQRRDLVVQEANAIGTAWLRAGLFDAPHGPALRATIEDYTSVRLDYLLTTDRDRLRVILQRTNTLQGEIWQSVDAIVRQRPDAVASSLVASVNEMIDLSLSQRFAFANRVPIYLLWSVFLGSMLSIGAMQFQFGIARQRQPVLTGLLLFMWTGALILIIDLNRPRIGGLTIDPSPIVWTLEGFKPAPK